MKKINSTNRSFEKKFAFQIHKAVCLLILLSTYAFANAQCDLKLTEKVTKQLQGDGFTYLKDFIIEFEEVNSTKAYSLLLKKDIRYFLYFGVSERYVSEMKFWITPDKSNEKQLTVTSGKIATIEITPEETAIYNFHTQSTKGEKSCGVIVFGVEASAKNSEVKTNTDEEVYVVVDQMPMFVNDQNITFRKWVEKNTIGADIIKRKGLEGKVYLTFVVNSVGDVTDIQVIKGIDPEIDAFFVDVLKKCPRWHPGKQKNKPVSVRFTIPISVKLKP
ncbi:MAG TPA: energy transducer TonB [Bacteroidales bacterium]|nr:energy transducer TonB [Bacteroidales bacterium]